MRTEAQPKFQIGRTPLRAEPPRGLDTIPLALRHSPTDILKFPKHLARFNRPKEYTYANPPRVTHRDYLDGLRTILDDRPIRPEVWQTFQANIVYGINADPGVFRRKLINHSPTPSDLRTWNLTEDHVVEALQKPPILAGSLLMVHWDGMDSNSVWMRRVASGPYKGRYTIGGGHFDNLLENAAFEEAREEAGLTDFRHASPLCTADQIVAVGSGNQLSLAHYRNFVWEYGVPYDHAPENTDLGRPWVRVWDDDLESMQRLGRLTPIAECALSSTRILL